jgi:hypothetical protein
MEEDKNKVNETGVEYKSISQSGKRTITFFNSFEEAQLSGLREMASHTPEQRLANLEILRKRTYHHLLLPDGSWPKMPRIITIEYGTFK